jgi:hypothetical protein
VSVLGIPDPDGTLAPCPGCGHATVVATTSTGAERLHCGTYEPVCRPAKPASRAIRLLSRMAKLVGGDQRH